jgi:hypothetical protein
MGPLAASQYDRNASIFSNLQPDTCGNATEIIGLECNADVTFSLNSNTMTLLTS